MSKINDGGRVIPLAGYFDENGSLGGLKVRDWFAGMAMSSGDCTFNTHEHPECSAWAYERADAMIAAREAGK